jgi:hypothetical protein|tara:strand:+ start:2285 stop:2617 length:333 start_codon:yes stop_codon:yes gene_type:complete
MSYLKASDVLPVALIDIVQQHIETKYPDFSGGSIYVPARGSVDVRNKSTSEKAYSKAFAIIAMHDGFTQEEAAQMVGASRNTVLKWKSKYGDRVIETLKELRNNRSQIND